MIREGAKVLLVDNEGKKHVVAAARKMLEVGRLGVIDGEALCNLSIGDAIRVGGKEFRVLNPSMKDLLAVMERRAQVMIPKDSYMIPMHLDLGCGSRVIEGGVGSGALTLVLLKAVAPQGAVFSYEIREEHAAVARRNIALSEHAGCWQLKVADVCTAPLEQAVDAAVLDMPNPWDALENVTSAVRPGGYICCYVPNANQLETAVRKMRELQLSEVVAFENIQREMVVHEGGVRPSFDGLGHTGYLAFARKTWTR